jgi:hypothetical protein
MGPDRVRVFTEDEWRDVGPSGAGPVSALPAPFRRAAFAGPHGLALTYDGFALETHDGGATFARVLVPDAPLPSPSTVGLRGCRLAGCDFGAAARVGWEYASPAAEPLSVARATPAAAPAKVLRCKVSGPPTKRKERLRAGDNLDQRVALGWNPDLTTPTRSYAFGLAHAGELLGAFLATPEHTDGDSDDYPYEKLFGQRPAYMTLRRVGAPRVVQATIPPPKSTTTWTTRRFQVESDAGVGFATLRFRTPAEGSQTYSAIDATLWAYDAASDKSVSAQLNGLPSFRVGQVGMGAFFAPVTGGFVFLAPTGPLRSYEIGSPAVSMRRPPGSHDWTQAARAGTMLALLAGGGERTTIALTGDRGASWTVGTFGLDNPQLGVTGGHVVVTGGIGTQGYVIPLNPSTKLDGDLPPWKPAVLSGLRVCPATDAGAPISLTLGPGELEIVRKDPEGADEATPMEVSQERVRVRSDGSVCMSALLGEEMWGIAVAMPGGAGQLVESDPASDAGGMMVSPLTCEPL